MQTLHFCSFAIFISLVNVESKYSKHKMSPKHQSYENLEPALNKFQQAFDGIVNISHSLRFSCIARPNEEEKQDFDT